MIESAPVVFSMSSSNISKCVDCAYVVLVENNVTLAS